mmetsp:Transcript_7282/g.16527  ORF Transcript_7282/g.16527 Transcript_7282/m.16527 type:complete len:87 (-) Transcript_7282:532-792(-)
MKQLPILSLSTKSPRFLLQNITRTNPAFICQLFLCNHYSHRLISAAIVIKQPSPIISTSIAAIVRASLQPSPQLASSTSSSIAAIV